VVEGVVIARSGVAESDAHEDTPTDRRPRRNHFDRDRRI